MGTRLRLPHEVSGHWETVLDCLCHVRWTPMNIITAIDKIRKSSYKQVKDMPCATRFAGLLKFFNDPYYVAGNPELFWGDYYFGSHNPDSNIKGWFLAHTVPYMVQLVIGMQETFPSGLPILSSRNEPTQEVKLSKHQCASLLACSFFCAFHYTANPKKKAVNFDNIFISLNKNCRQNVAKLCMIMNYFERCRLKMNTQSQTVLITRHHSLSPLTLTTWASSAAPLTEFKVNSYGSINDAGCDTLHADFANKWIGGGVLHKGAVQEEIMFSICPELLTTIHICDVMNDNEAIVITGTEEYSLHKGYSRTLAFVGNAPPTEGTTSRVAMDATRFAGDRNCMRQYDENTILRELNKAHVAFNHNYPAPGSAVATGNWGCGAFGGHVQLKSMLQWVAASVSSRPVIYYTFQDENCKGLEGITKFLMEKNTTAGKLFETVKLFCDQVEAQDSPKHQLFSFLRDSYE